jgi:hypothetical protein
MGAQARNGGTNRPNCATGVQPARLIPPFMRGELRTSSPGRGLSRESDVAAEERPRI